MDNGPASIFSPLVLQCVNLTSAMEKVLLKYSTSKSILGQNAGLKSMENKREGCSSATQHQYLMQEDSDTGTCLLCLLHHSVKFQMWEKTVTTDRLTIYNGGGNGGRLSFR